MAYQYVKVFGYDVLMFELNDLNVNMMQLWLDLSIYISVSYFYFFYIISCL